MSAFQSTAKVTLVVASSALVVAILLTQIQEVGPFLQEGWYWALRQSGLAREFVGVPYDFP